MLVGSETITKDDMPTRQMYNPYHLQQTIADIYNSTLGNGAQMQQGGQAQQQQPLAPMDTQNDNGGREW